MRKYIRFIVGGCLMLAAFGSCTSSEGEVEERIGKLDFTGRINSLTRATDTSFQDEDTIGVFGFLDNSGFSDDSYATNVKYVYVDGHFKDDGPGILYPPSKDGLAFWAIYPYSKQAGTTFIFQVREDQRKVFNYTRSDLMTASIPKTTSPSPEFLFSHQLACVALNISFDGVDEKSAKLSVCKVLKGVTVDMSKGTFLGTGLRVDTVRALPDGVERYKVILPPQKVEVGTYFVAIKTESGASYTWKLPHTLTFLSGRRYTYNLKLTVQGTVSAFSTEINDWNSGETETLPMEPGV